MKKIYLLLPLVMLATIAFGQIDYTFEVDMNGETVSANGVHVAGNFQAASGQAGDWDPATSELLDGDTDGIYTLTVNIPAGGYEYKFINGNDWPDAEGIPEVSQVGFGNGNRYFQLTAVSDSTTGAIVFGGSAPTGMTAIKLQVDLPDGPDAEGAHVAGSIFDPAWAPSATALYNIGNNVYAVSYHVIDGDYSYKFLTGNDWGSDEQSIPADCSTDGNRTVTIAGNDTITDVVCFNACGPCSSPSSITFKVDMSLACFDLSSDTVNLMGTVTNWGDGAAMNDDDADGVWELTIDVQPGDWEYKFRVGAGGWEGIGNRPLTVVEGENQDLEVDCWNSSDPCSAAAFSPADVTFTVNLNDSTLEDGESAWLMGDFTAPAWQDGAIQMTDNGDGTWSATVADFCPQDGRYKFAYGTTPNGDVWVEENAEFAQEGGCGEDNGSFPDNRVIVRNTNDAMTVCFTFNTCDDCAVGIAEMESLNRVEIYPNPASDVINIEFDQYGQYNVRIMDISGKLIYSDVVNTDRLRIEDNNMISGVYFVQIADEFNNVVTKKLVVK